MKNLHHAWQALFLVVLITGVALLQAPAPALGYVALPADLTVNTLTDENDHSCSDGDCSLRDALEVAGAGDTIQFSVTGTITLALGQLTLTRDVTISGPGANNLSVDAHQASRVFYVNESITAILSGITVANGRVEGVGLTVAYGGGIQNSGALTINDCTFSGNAASYPADGGAIANFNILTVNRSTFHDNHVDGYDMEEASGGAIWSSSAITVNDSTFTDNESGLGGGAISTTNALTVHHSTFSGNSTGASGGGAIGSSVSGLILVDHSTFTENSAGGGGGAILRHSNYGNLTITDSTFSGNTTPWYGGALFIINDATITNSTFSNNTAAEGGGAIQNSGGLQVTNSTFFGNHASVGGAIRNEASVALNSATLSGNIADVAGASIESMGTVTAGNSIFANPVTGVNCRNNAFIDNGGNLRWPSTDTSCVGDFGDPKLGTLQDNGGATYTMALGADSAALESAVAANCPATDQRDQARPNPAGTVCDIGAYESELRPPAVEETSPDVVFDNWRGEENPNATNGVYHESSNKNNTVTFKFTGRAVTWLAKKSPDMGIAQVTIDGVDKASVDLYSATEQWQFARTFKKLTNAKHTLVIRVSGSKNIKSSDVTVGVDGFQVAATVTDDTAPNVKYNQWSSKKNAAASGGTYRVSKDKASRARFTFNGTKIEWLTAKGPAYGKAAVYIDGLVRGTYDLYAPAARWQVAVRFTDLSAGQHTIEIRVLGTKNAKSTGSAVVVDAFR